MKPQSNHTPGSKNSRADEGDPPPKNGSPESSVRNLFLWIARTGEEIPEAERALIPRDLARNHEHYLYGLPKQS